MDEETAEFHEQFLRLFTANESAIRAFVRRLVPTRGDAADVMQGVSLVLWKKFAELEERGQFRKWAFGVARYETLAWLRDKARDRLVLANDVLDALASDSSQNEQRLSAQPSTERPGAAAVMELRQLLHQHRQHVLDQVVGVGVLHAVLVEPLS